MARKHQLLLLPRRRLGLGPQYDVAGREFESIPAIQFLPSWYPGDIPVSLRQWERASPHLQLRTNKVINFDNLRTRIFIKILTSDSESETLKLSRKVSLPPAD